MAAKFFTGLPVDGPDPECVLGHGERALAARGSDTPPPRPSVDRSRRLPRDVGTFALPVVTTSPARACDESPVASLTAPDDRRSGWRAVGAR
jgi:hypothetical protein